VQKRIRELLGVGDLPSAIDVCGIPTYAAAYCAGIVADAHTLTNRERDARPDLVGGDGADDTALWLRLLSILLPMLLCYEKARIR